MGKGTPSNSKAIALLLLSLLLLPAISTGIVLAQGYSFTLTSVSPNPVSLGSSVILSATLCPNPSGGISVYVYYTRPDSSTVSRSAAHNSQDFCSAGFTVDSYVPDQAGAWSVYAQAYVSGQLLATSNTLQFTVQSNGFSISPPLTTSVFQGTSTSEYVDVTSASSQSYTVALTASGAPTGVSISFNPNNQNPPFQTTMTISATSSATTGTSTVTVSGSGGGYSASNSFQLTVSPASQAPFDFALSVTPTSQTVTAGGTLNPAGTVSISVLQGTAQPVTLSLSNLPSYVGTTDLNGMSCTPQCAPSFEITTLPSAPGGAYYLTITGTSSGGATHSIPYTLNVSPLPRLYVTIAASSQNVYGGSSVTLTASVSSSIGGAPSPLTYSWTDDNCGQLSSTTTNPVTWTAPGVSSQIACSISVTVSSPGYLSGSYSVAITVVPSTTTSTTTTTTTSTTTATEAPTYTFALTSVSPNPVSLGSQVMLYGTLCPSPSTGVTTDVYFSRPDQTIVQVTSSHNHQDFCSSPFTVEAYTPDQAGTWSVFALAYQGSTLLAHSNTIQFGVASQGFSLSITPQVGAYQGSSGTVNVTVSSSSPQSYSVTLDATGLPSGVSATFTPPSDFPPFSSTLTLALSTDATPGAYVITVSGTGGGNTASNTFTLDVYASTTTTTTSTTSGETPTTTSSTSTTVSSSGPASGSATSTTASTQSIQVVGEATTASRPFWGDTFDLEITIANTGSEPISSTRLPELDASPIFPTTDAVGQTPVLLCSFTSGPSTLAPGDQAVYTYTCAARKWTVMAPPSLLGTVVDSFASLGLNAISTSNTGSDFASAIQNQIHNPRLLSIFQTEASLGGIAADTIKNAQDAEAALSVIQLVENNQATLGVDFQLSLATAFYPVEGSPGSATVYAPPQKLSELHQWAVAKIVDIAISAGLATAGTASLAGCATGVGCLVPGVLLAASALAGPVTDALFQHELADPSPNYATLVSVESPPEFITTLPNSTDGRLAYYEFEYIAFLNASVESSIRGYGAESAGSGYWASAQFSQAKLFAASASSFYDQFRLYLNQTLMEQGPINETSFQTGLNYLRTNGLPLDVQRLLNATGTLGAFTTSLMPNLSYLAVNSTAISQSLPNVGSYLQSDANLQLTYTPTTTSQTQTTTEGNGQTPAPWLTNPLYWGVAALVLVVILAVVLQSLRTRRR